MARHDMTYSTCYRRHAHHVKRGRGTLFGLILGFSSQTLTRRTGYLGVGGSEDMFTLLRGRDTGLGHHTQVGMLTCVHARVSLGHDDLT